MNVKIQARNTEVSRTFEEWIERRLLFALSRFGDRIRRVTALMEDINGPRGGVDKRCRVTVRARGAWTVTVRDLDADLHSVISRAVARAGHAVSRRVARRRPQPTAAWLLRRAAS